MNRTIVDFHRDDEGDWVAFLSCGHGQHVRHRPPFQIRPWVVDDEGRRGRLGTVLDCPLCDRAELPNGLRLIGPTPPWDEDSMPGGLRRAHRLAHGRWGQLMVLDGQLRFVAHTDPVIDVIVSSESVQAIPPEVEHFVQPLGLVHFLINLFVIRQHDSDIVTLVNKEAPQGGELIRTLDDEGGESACWAHLLCPECGVVLDGEPHLDGCGLGADR